MAFVLSDKYYLVCDIERCTYWHIPYVPYSSTNMPTIEHRVERNTCPVTPRHVKRKCVKDINDFKANSSTAELACNAAMKSQTVSFAERYRYVSFHIRVDFQPPGDSSSFAFHHLPRLLARAMLAPIVAEIAAMASTVVTEKATISCILCFFLSSFCWSMYSCRQADRVTTPHQQRATKQKTKQKKQTQSLKLNARGIFFFCVIVGKT